VAAAVCGRRSRPAQEGDLVEATASLSSGFPERSKRKEKNTRASVLRFGKFEPETPLRCLLFFKLQLTTVVGWFQ